MAYIVLMLSSLFLLLLFTHTLAGDDDTAMTYLGCFQEKFNYEAFQTNFVVGSVSIDMCFRHCRDMRYNYFMIKANWCQCTNVLSSEKAITGCNNTIANTQYYDYHGNGSLYKINAWASSYLEYIDCLKDNETDKDFLQESLLVDKTNLTLEKCMKHCSKHQYWNYMAIQNGVECRCGYMYRKLAEKGKCCTQCKGNKLQYCGGNSTNSIYVISDAKPIVYSQDCFMVSKRNYDRKVSGKTVLNLNVQKCSMFCREYRYMSIQSKENECFCHDEQYVEPFDMRCRDCANKPGICDGRVMVASYGITEVNYWGCFIESSSLTNSWTDWGHQSKFQPTMQRSNMTLTECGIFCANKRYEFMGLTGGSGCKCMENTLSGLGRKSICEMPCTGDIGQICGDVNKYSVYSLNSVTPISHKPSVPMGYH